MIDEIVRRLLEIQIRQKEKNDGDYEVIDMLMCRKKMEFIREKKVPDVKDTDISRQAVISKFVHNGMQNMLESLEWITDGRYARYVGKYRLIMTADAAKYKNVNSKPEGDIHYVEAMRGDYLVVKELVEIKCPVRLPNKIPDSTLFQARMYLWITGAEKCTVLFMHHQGFKEVVVDKPMEEHQIEWLIEHPSSPYYKNECNSCFYRKYCNVYVNKEGKTYK